MEARAPPHEASPHPKAEPMLVESPLAIFLNGMAPVLTGAIAHSRARAVGYSPVDYHGPGQAQAVSQDLAEVAAAAHGSDTHTALDVATAGSAILKSLGLAIRLGATSVAAADGQGESPWGDAMEAIIRKRWRAALADPGLTTAHALPFAPGA